MRWLLLSLALTPSAFATSHEALSPVVAGDTLLIRGRIESHIYDYLAYEAKQLRAVRFVSLDSFGGNIQWAQEIADRLHAMGISTLLPSGQHCASACVLLFASGRERLAARDSWLGIHSARGGAQFERQFSQSCFLDGTFQPDLADCESAISKWREAAAAATAALFAKIESFGIAPELAQKYLSLPDESDWAENLNIMKKPDWKLPAEEARKYQLVTGFLL